MVTAALVAGNVLALVLAGLLLAIELWTVVPAPTLRTLALAVAVPEVAPWGIVAALVVGALVQAIARGWARSIAVGAAALSLGCALIPLVLLGPAIAASDRELTHALGAGYADAAPDRKRARMLHAPFDVATSFRGLPRVTGIRFDLDLPVMTRDGTRLALDLYRPAAGGAHPTVIVIYGGAWLFGSRADSAEISRAFAALGYTAVAVDYRHAPQHRYPTEIDDVRDALSTVAKNAAKWEVDSARVAILGRSSGAELALLAAYDPGPLTIKAAIAYYSPIDLVQGYRIPPAPDPADVRRILRAYLGGPPEANPDGYVKASPIAHVHANLPPTLLIGGGRDELVRLAFQHEMRDALRVHGNRVASIELPWSNHAFDTIPSGIGGQIARYYTERFLAATL